MGRKRHSLVGAEELVLRMMCLPADIQDQGGAEYLFLINKPVSPRLEPAWAGSAYRRNELLERAERTCDWKLEVISRPAGAQGFVTMHHCNAVEWRFGQLGRNRRPTKEYEELIETIEAWCYAAMTRLMLRRLTAHTA